MSLAKRAFTVSSWTLASRVLGLVRDRLWAGALGGSLMLDAFLVAFAVPNLLRNLFGEGALSAAFIPRYVQEREKDPAKAERFAGAVLTRMALGLSLLAALGLAGAAAMMFTGSPKAVVVAAMALPQIPFLIFICIVAIMAGMLNGRRHFWVPAAAPVVLNVCLIATVWMEPEDEAWTLPYAVLVAGILQVLMHVWALARTPGGVPPVVTASTPEIRELRGALVPAVIASSIYQVNALLDSIIAMVFIPGAGAVAFLYFGNRLLQFPMALIGHGVTTAAYPELARRAGEGWASTGDGLREASRLQSYWLLPAAVGLLVTAEPLVRTIYQTGSFGEEGVERTVLVTRMLALALIPITLSKLMVRGFHARRDQRTPMRVSIGMVALNLTTNLLLVTLTPLREAGLALSTAVSSMVGCGIYVVLLRRHGAGTVIDLRGSLRPIAAAAAMGVAVASLLHAWPQPFGHASGMAALRLAVAIAVGGLLYVPLAGTSWLRRPKRGVPAGEDQPSDPAATV
ncbi:MAG: murein biosynthesis integral membrane protein MurJ [Planctomycetes bacterium]|nr:murein biosynthesis integral membrane protein MurJ [Planctomycetota bacterium]